MNEGLGGELNDDEDSSIPSSSAAEPGTFSHNLCSLCNSVTATDDSVLYRNTVTATDDSNFQFLAHQGFELLRTFQFV